MHNQQHLTNIISRCTNIDYSQIHPIHLYGSMIDSVKEEIAQNHNKFILLLGWDRSSDYTDVLDEWEYLDSLSYRPLVLDLDYLLPEKRPYKRINRIWYNQNCLGNIEVLLMHQPIMDIEYRKGPWLSLMRKIYDLRAYTFNSWISKMPESFSWSFGESKFFGSDLNFYERPKNNFGPDMINNNNFLDLLPEFNRCGGSIVSETCCDQTMTEKTFQAIMAGHPILLIGIKSSISHLRDHGFDMFDDILDHSYDELDDCPERVDRLFEDNNEVILSGIDRSKLADRLEHNRQNLWNYRNSIIKKMTDEIKSFYQGE